MAQYPESLQMRLCNTALCPDGIAMTWSMTSDWHLHDGAIQPNTQLRHATGQSHIPEFWFSCTLQSLLFSGERACVCAWVCVYIYTNCYFLLVSGVKQFLNYYPKANFFFCSLKQNNPFNISHSFLTAVVEITLHIVLSISCLLCCRWVSICVTLQANF